MADKSIQTLIPIVVEADLESAGPLMFGKKFVSERAEGETSMAFEERCWRERMHVNERGDVYIPAIALKKTLRNTATYLSEPIPGKGKATYSKHFRSGILVTSRIELGIKAKDVKGLKLNVPAQPQRPNGPKVDRIFPVIEHWKGHAELIVTDPILISSMPKVEQYLVFSGKFIGLLSMRIGNGGEFGRYAVKNIRYEKIKV